MQYPVVIVESKKARVYVCNDSDWQIYEHIAHGIFSEIIYVFKYNGVVCDSSWR